MLLGLWVTLCACVSSHLSVLLARACSAELPELMGLDLSGLGGFHRAKGLRWNRS